MLRLRRRSARSRRRPRPRGFRGRIRIGRTVHSLRLLRGAGSEPKPGLPGPESAAYRIGRWESGTRSREVAMEVERIMTSDPACCTPDTPLQDVARLMVENDCGQIPVVDDKNNMRTIGVITDRDIVCRALARGGNPLTMTAEHVMTQPVLT